MSLTKEAKLPAELLDARQVTMELFGRGYAEFIRKPIGILRDRKFAYPGKNTVQLAEEVCDEIDRSNHDLRFKLSMKHNVLAAAAETLINPELYPEMK